MQLAMMTTECYDGIVIDDPKRRRVRVMWKDMVPVSWVTMPENSDEVEHFEAVPADARAVNDSGESQIFRTMMCPVRPGQVMPLRGACSISTNGVYHLRYGFVWAREDVPKAMEHMVASLSVKDKKEVTVYEDDNAEVTKYVQSNGSEDHIFDLRCHGNTVELPGEFFTLSKWVPVDLLRHEDMLLVCNGLYVEALDRLHRRYAKSGRFETFGPIIVGEEVKKVRKELTSNKKEVTMGEDKGLARNVSDAVLEVDVNPGGVVSADCVMVYGLRGSSRIADGFKKVEGEFYTKRQIEVLTDDSGRFANQMNGKVVEAFKQVKKLLNDKVPDIMQHAEGDTVKAVGLLLNGLVASLTTNKSIKADLQGMQDSDDVWQGREREHDGMFFSRDQNPGVIRKVKKTGVPCDDQSGDDVCADAESIGFGCRGGPR